MFFWIGAGLFFAAKGFVKLCRAAVRAMLFGLLILMLLWDSCTGASQSDARRTVQSALQITLPACEVQTALDSHGGFLGDGETLIELTFSDDSFVNEIQGRATWDALPLDGEYAAVHAFLEHSWEYGIRFYEETRSVQNGYRYFKDRATDAASEDAYAAELTLERYCYNFTFAIYDADTRTLYFYMLDT